MAKAIYARLPAELYKKIKILCATKGITLQDAVQKAMEDFIKNGG